MALIILILMVFRKFDYNIIAFSKAKPHHWANGIVYWMKGSWGRGNGGSRQSAVSGQRSEIGTLEYWNFGI